MQSGLPPKSRSLGADSEQEGKNRKRLAAGDDVFWGLASQVALAQPNSLRPCSLALFLQLIHDRDWAGKGATSARMRLI